MKKQSVKKRKNILRYLILDDFLLILTMSFSLAYFTGFDEVTNRFIAKSMDISLYEEKYNSLTEKQRSTLIPNKLLPKDPRVQNIKETDVFVFVKVTVPVYASSVIEDDGTVCELAHPQEVFFLKTAEKADEGQTSFHTKENDEDKAYWVELPSFEEGTDLQSETRTYIFGYSVYLKPYEITETLFDYIQLKNIRQFEITPGDRLEVNVDAYGIQADFLDEIEKDSTFGKAVLTHEQLSTIYRYIYEDENSDNN